MGKKQTTMKTLALALLLVAAVVAQDAVESVEDLPESVSMLETEGDVTISLLPPTRAAAIKGKGVISRVCMNECGGLCRSLCSKFKALKVCNGCVRGCINKCGTGDVIANNPFFDPWKVRKPGSVPPMGANGTKNRTATQ